jgi:hypothetical protein
MSSRVWALLAASVVLSATMVVPAVASTLGDAALKLGPGQWTVLNRAGDAAGFTYEMITACQPSGCYDTILNYADKGLWNPATREIEFLGKGHMAEHKHITYSEANHRWTVRTRPSWACGVADSCYGMGHGYEHSANNPATGDMYARIQSSGTVYKWTRASQSWAQLPQAPVLEIAIALEYFPEMGGLLYVGTRNGAGEVHLYRESTGTWTQLASGLAMGPYHNVASYNPVHKIVVFGGGNGSTQLYKIDASGKVAAIANAPVGVGILQSVFTVDPASGRHLLFGSGGGFYEYDVAANRWTALSTSGVPLFRSDDPNRIWMRVAVPISTHGVVAFLAEGGNADTRVLLYRHAASTPPVADTTPPAPPVSLSIK